MLATLRGYAEVIDFPDDRARVVSWLPMAHIAERACSHYLPIGVGYEATRCPDPREVVACLPEVRPTWFFAVPRIWEKLKAALEAQGITEPGGAARRGQGRLCARSSGSTRPARSTSGRRRAPPEVIEFFHALGVPLAELWGMSESCASGCVNPPGRVKIGTVGPPLPGFELRLADDGEVLLRGAGGDDAATATARADAPRRSTPTAGSPPATSASSTRTGT